MALNYAFEVKTKTEAGVRHERYQLMRMTGRTIPPFDDFKNTTNLLS